MYLEAHAVLPAVGLQLGGVVRAGGGLGQPVLCQQVEIRRGAVSQDQDLPLDAGLPQLDRLVQRGSGKVADAQLPAAAVRRRSLPKILDPVKRSYQWQFFSEYPKSAKKASFLQVFLCP